MVLTVYFYIRLASFNSWCSQIDSIPSIIADKYQSHFTVKCHVVGFSMRMNSLSSAWPRCWRSRGGGQAPGRIQDPPQRHGGIPQAPHLTARGAPDVSHLKHYFCLLTLTCIAAVQEFIVFQFVGLLLLNVSHELKRAFLVKSEWWMLYVFKIDIFGNQIWYFLIKSDGLNLFLQGNMLKT